MKLPTTESLGLSSTLWGQESLKQGNRVKATLFVHLGNDL